MNLPSYKCCWKVEIVLWFLILWMAIPLPQQQSEFINEVLLLLEGKERRRWFQCVRLIWYDNREGENQWSESSTLWFEWRTMKNIQTDHQLVSTGNNNRPVFPWATNFFYEIIRGQKRRKPESFHSNSEIIIRPIYLLGRNNDIVSRRGRKRGDDKMFVQGNSENGWHWPASSSLESERTTIATYSIYAELTVYLLGQSIIIKETGFFSFSKEIERKQRKFILKAFTQFNDGIASSPYVNIDHYRDQPDGCHYFGLVSTFD